MSLGYDYCLKFVVVGDACSGKTTMVQRLCYQDINKYYEPTIGVEYNSTHMRYKEHKLKIQYWDTAGDRCYAPIIKSYYKNIAGLYLVVDLTKKNSLRTMNKWFNEINQNKVNEFKTIVVGTKSESRDRVIKKEEILKMLKPNNIEYIEYSSFTNENLLELNYKMVDAIFNEFDVENHRGIVSSKKEIIDLKNKSTNTHRTCNCIIC